MRSIPGNLRQIQRPIKEERNQQVSHPLPLSISSSDFVENSKLSHVDLSLQSRDTRLLGVTTTSGSLLGGRWPSIAGRIVGAPCSTLVSGRFGSSSTPPTRFFSTGITTISIRTASTILTFVVSVVVEDQLAIFWNASLKEVRDRLLGLKKNFDEPLGKILIFVTIEGCG
jgi:hypothetical protein